LIMMVTFAIIGVVFVFNLYSMAKISLIFQPRSLNYVPQQSDTNDSIGEMITKESHKGLASLHTVQVSKVPRSLKHSHIVSEDFERRYSRFVAKPPADALYPNPHPKAVVGSSICFDLRELKNKKRYEIGMQKKLEDCRNFYEKTGKRKVLLNRVFFGKFLKNICCKFCCFFCCACGCCGLYYNSLELFDFLFESLNEFYMFVLFSFSFSFSIQNISFYSFVNTELQRFLRLWMKN